MKKNILSFLCSILILNATAQLRNTAPLFEEELNMQIETLHEKLDLWGGGSTWNLMSGDNFDMLFLQTDVALDKFYSNKEFSELFMAASSYKTGIKRIKSSVISALNTLWKDKNSAEGKKMLKEAASKEKEKYDAYLAQRQAFREKYAEQYKDAVTDEVNYFIRLTKDQVNGFKREHNMGSLSQIKRLFYKTDPTLMFVLDGKTSVRATIKDISSHDVSEKNMQNILSKIEKALISNGFTKTANGKTEWSFIKSAKTPAEVVSNEVKITSSDFAKASQIIIEFFY